MYQNQKIGKMCKRIIDIEPRKADWYYGRNLSTLFFAKNVRCAFVYSIQHLDGSFIERSDKWRYTLIWNIILIVCLQMFTKIVLILSLAFSISPYHCNSHPPSNSQLFQQTAFSEI